MKPIVKEAIERLTELRDRPMAEFRDAIIAEMCRITDSSIAYFYASDLTEEHLTLLGYSKTVMESCEIIGGRPSVYLVSETGLWGDAVRERRAIITNDYARSTSPSKRGYPKGYVELTRHMNLPVFENGRIVAVVGVGNKVAPYTQTDVENLEALMTEIWVVFEDALWAAVW